MCNSGNSKFYAHCVVFILTINIPISRCYSSDYENELDTRQNGVITTKSSYAKCTSDNCKSLDSESKIHKLTGLGLQQHETFRNDMSSERTSNKYDALKESEVYSNSLSSRSNGSWIQNELNSLLEDYVEVSDDLTLEEKRRQDAFQLTKPDEHPYSVMLLIVYANLNGSGSVCTGSLLTEEWVLTAAHCLKETAVKYVIIDAGGYKIPEPCESNIDNCSQSLMSTEFYPHPEYTTSGFDFDVGLVKVNKKFNLTNKVKTVRLSKTPWSYQGYHNCVFTGFGSVQINESHPEDNKRKTHYLMMKKPCVCELQLSLEHGAEKVSRYICSKPMEDYGSCPGDSGGGLVCDGEIKGIAMQLATVEDLANCNLAVAGSFKCGSKNTITVFQDTCPFLLWINSHVKMFKDNQISKECVKLSGGCHGNDPKERYMFILILLLINMCIFS